MKFTIIISVFLEQPGPDPILAPIDAQVELSCSVTESYGVDWAVTLPDTMEVTTDQRGVPDKLKEHGIEAVGLMNQRSTLTVSLNGSNNGTHFHCIAIGLQDVLNKCRGIDVKVIFYGKCLSS